MVLNAQGQALTGRIMTGAGERAILIGRFPSVTTAPCGAPAQARGQLSRAQAANQFGRERWRVIGSGARLTRGEPPGLRKPLLLREIPSPHDWPPGKIDR